MKKLLIATLFSIFTLFGLDGLTQEIQKPFHQEMHTVFGTQKGFGGYIGFNSHATLIDGKEALLLGGEVNALFGHSLAIGFKGYGLATEVHSGNLDANGTEKHLHIGYGGLNFEPILFPKSVIHLSFPVLIGGGGVAEFNNRFIWDVDPDFDEDFFTESNSDYFFFIEPGVNAEVNLTKFLRLSGGVSYRYATDISIPDIDNNLMNNMNVDLSLKLGWF